MFSVLLKGLFNNKFDVYEESLNWLKRNEINHFASESLESTNDLAKEEAFSISTPLKVYLAKKQTKGRGRNHNTWENPRPGDALLISFSFEIEKAPQPICSPLIGLSIFESLNESFTLSNLSIKAPNDLILSGLKLGGILVEATQMGDQHRLIIGFGLNIFSCPTSESGAICLNDDFKLRKSHWEKFLTHLMRHLKLSSQESMGSHLSESQREKILNALNSNPQLNDKYDGISPFADLSRHGNVTSWREL